MRYRRFGKVDFDASVLGFGCMRLPTLGDRSQAGSGQPGDPSQIDEPVAIKMIRHAIDRGVNYVDTAYMYHAGNSERVLGRALLDGYRQKVRLATKLPVGQVTSYADFDRLLNEQLAKLQTDHIDFYLLHGLRKSRWEIVRDLGVTSWAEGAKRDGRIRHLGFSFHDNADAFKYIVDDYAGWDFCQVQYNFMDVNTQAGMAGVRYAAARGLAVVVMEPLLGGRLATPPTAVEAIWRDAPVRRTPVDWALRWVWDQPEVSVVLSGMSTPEQVEENLASAEQAEIGGLSAGEHVLFDRAREVYSALYPIPCTQCGYCMPCPNGVDIPTNFLLFNRGVALDQLQSSRFRYGNGEAGARASACVQCRECEDKCPQSIQIGDWMPYVDEVLGKKIDFDPARVPVRPR